jgi:hypothetical protein
MLKLDQCLPLGALLGREGDQLAGLLAASGAIWFHASAESVRWQGDRITGWRSRDGAGMAETTVPNQGGTRFAAEIAALRLTKGSHCGLSLRQASSGADCFTAAVIYATPTEDARSLLAVNTGAANNMIFLSDAEGEVTAKDRSGGVTATLPARRLGARPRLAMFSLSAQGVFLRAGGKTTLAQGRVLAMDAPADLFIGCRSDRPGLTKTLGGADIHDVIFWPNRAVLAQQDPSDAVVLEALDRYLRWSFAETSA